MRSKKNGRFIGNPPVEKQCVVCNANFSVRFIRTETAKFCSMRCKGMHSKGIDLPQFIHIKGVRTNTGRTHFKKGSIPANYKGANVSYSGLHKWVRLHKGIPDRCEICEKSIAKRFEWASKSRTYQRDINDWLSLCKPCHVRYDDAANKAWVTRRSYE